MFRTTNHNKQIGEPEVRFRKFKQSLLTLNLYFNKKKTAKEKNNFVKDWLTSVGFFAVFFFDWLKRLDITTLWYRNFI